MKQTFSFLKNGLRMTFGVDDAEHLLLLGVSATERAPISEDRHFTAANVHLSGENVTDAHGNKHTGCGELRYLSHSEEADSLTFRLESDKLEVLLVYEFPRGCSVFRTHTEIRNIAEEEVGLEYISSLALFGMEPKHVYLPHNSWFRELNWKKYTLRELGLTCVNPQSTKRFVASNIGTWSTKDFLPSLILEREEECLFASIEHNGSWTYEIGNAGGTDCLLMSGPCEQEHAFYRTLAPGERFRSVDAVCAVAKGKLDCVIGEMTRYRRTVAYRSPADRSLPVIFNDYMGCIWADPTTEKELPVIEAAARAGAEFYVMDAGWYANGTWWETVGEWEVYEPRFPGGIKRVFDHIRACGMTPGIWLEPEVMGIHCPIADSFPDECFFMRHGKRVIDNGRYQFDFRHPITRAHLDRVIDRLVSELGIGYFKFDYNIDGGLGTEVDADSFGDGLLQANEAFLDWIDSLYVRHPSLVIENCSSGGLRMEYRSLAHFSIQSLTDAETCERLAPIAANALTAVIPEQAAVWSVPKADGTLGDIALSMVSPMFRRFHLGGETASLSPEFFALVKEGIDFYKSIRCLIPEMTGFFPLGICTFDDDWQVAGFETKYVRYLTVARLAGEEELTIPLDEPLTGAEIVYPAASPARISLDGGTLRVAFRDRNAVVLRLS